MHSKAECPDRARSPAAQSGSGSVEVTALSDPEPRLDRDGQDDSGRDQARRWRGLRFGRAVSRTPAQPQDPLFGASVAALAQDPNGKKMLRDGGPAQPQRPGRPTISRVVPLPGPEASPPGA